MQAFAIDRARLMPASHDALSTLMHYFETSLSTQSLHFLSHILHKNPLALQQLPVKLKRHVNSFKGTFTATHLDTVIDAFYQQQRCDLVRLKKEDYVQLQTACIPPIAITQASATTLQLLSQLSLFVEDTPLHQTIQAMMPWILHAAHDSPLRTFNQLRAMWYKKISNPALHALIDCVLHRLILLSTALIEGPTRHMPLSELFFIIEAFDEPHADASDFLNQLNAALLVISLCHHQPLAIYDTMVHDAILLQEKRPDLSCFQDFFSSAAFQTYFKEQHPYAMLDPFVFLSSFTLHQDKTLQQHIESSLNRVGYIIFTANKLISMGFSPRSPLAYRHGLFQPLINPERVVTHAKNLKHWQAFFNTLSIKQQEHCQKIFKSIRYDAIESTSTTQNLLKK